MAHGGGSPRPRHLRHLRLDILLRRGFGHALHPTSTPRRSRYVCLLGVTPLPCCRHAAPRGRTLRLRRHEQRAGRCGALDGDDSPPPATTSRRDDNHLLYFYSGSQARASSSGGGRARRRGRREGEGGGAGARASERASDRPTRPAAPRGTHASSPAVAAAPRPLVRRGGGHQGRRLHHAGRGRLDTFAMTPFVSFYLTHSVGARRERNALTEARNDVSRVYNLRSASLQQN